MDLSDQALLTYKVAAIGGWLALLFALERLLPAAARPIADGRFGWRRLGRNFGLFVLNIGLSPVLVVPVSALAASLALDWRPAWWSGLPGLVVDLLLLDLFLYWWHRANHAVPLLWRFHEVHHLDRFLDTSSALRFHFGEVALSAVARTAIIVPLGVPLSSVLVFETLVLMAALFHHSNLRLPKRFEGALSRVIITPSIHWVHHHAVRADTDSNYGTILSLWDRLFASRSPTPRRLDMPIGVEGEHDRGLPALLVRPLGVHSAADTVPAQNP